MQITIKTLTGNKLKLNVDDSLTVEQVKKKLEEINGINFKQMRLIFGGKQLLDSKTLAEYDIKAGDTVHMILMMRGGLF